MGKKSEQTVPWGTRAIAKLPPPPAGQRTTFHHPDEHRLVVIVTSSDTRTFYVVTRVQGQQQRIKIGTFPAWTPTAAYHRATEIIKTIEAGENPHRERRERSAAPDLARYWSDFFEPAHVKQRLKPRTQRQYCETWANHIKDALGDAKLHDITRADVVRMHANIGADGRKRTANLAVAIVRCMLNHAMDAGLLKGSNPADRVRMFAETRRERYLSRDEIARLYQALEVEAQATGDWLAHDLFKVMLLTGARRGNVMAMRWQDIDLDGRRWMIPASQTKTGRLYVVGLAPGAAAILRQRRQQAPQDAVYVFPGRWPDKPIAEIKGLWKRVKERADLHGLRVHDLRHSAAAIMAAAGASLPTIGHQLGHTSPASTARYAHLAFHAVQEVVDRAMNAVGSTTTDGGE